MTINPSPSQQGPQTWLPDDWLQLLYAIKNNDCTPFLGAGACVPILPLGTTLAQEMAAKYDYPFEDRWNLPRVAQYVAIDKGADVPKYWIRDRLSGFGKPDFEDPTQIHRVVADLNLPVYVTTNYDDFMLEALKRPSRLNKQPQRDVCRWRDVPHAPRSIFDGGFEPAPAAPVVYHLHGTLDRLHSMVLTEDDYYEFLANVSDTPDRIPPRIEEAFAASTLLFLGYSLEDMNFRVIFRKLQRYMQKSGGLRHVSVQLARKGAGPDADSQAEQARRYLEAHFRVQEVRVYWGTCADFARDLQGQWDAFVQSVP